MAVITSLTPNSFNGAFETIVSEYSIAGQFNTNGDKVLMNIGGAVRLESALIVSFNAYRNGESFRYNFTDISDLSALATVAPMIASVVASVIEELSED